MKGDLQNGAENDYTAGKTAKEMRAEEKVRRAQAELAKIRRDQKKELRKAQQRMPS